MLNRRSLLEKAAFGSGLLFVAASGAYSLLNSPLIRQPASVPLQASDEWNFLRAPIILKQAFPEEANRYVPLGPETQLEEGSATYRLLRSKVTDAIIESRIRQQKLDPNANYSI